MKAKMKVKDGRVNLPTYCMIGEVKDGIVEVEFPDDEADKNGKPDLAKIRKKYKANKLWDREGVDFGVVSDE